MALYKLVDECIGNGGVEASAENLLPPEGELSHPDMPEWVEAYPTLQGDTHFLMFTDLVPSDYTKVPFNVDDNTTTTGILWFAAQMDDGSELKIWYDQQSFAPVAGGYTVKTVVITHNGVDITYIGSGAGATLTRNGVAWAGTAETFNLGNLLEITVSGKVISGGSACVSGGAAHALLKLITKPIGRWQTGIEKLGGVFYYLLKSAVHRGSGPVNNGSAASYDGISDFLSYCSAKTRSTFQTTTTNTNIWEDYDEDTVRSIVHKYNEMAGIEGTLSLSWDPAVNPDAC